MLIIIAGLGKIHSPNNHIPCFTWFWLSDPNFYFCPVNTCKMLLYERRNVKLKTGSEKYTCYNHYPLISNNDPFCTRSVGLFELRAAWKVHLEHPRWNIHLIHIPEVKQNHRMWDMISLCLPYHSHIYDTGVSDLHEEINAQPSWLKLAPGKVLGLGHDSKYL